MWVQVLIWHVNYFPYSKFGLCFVSNHCNHDFVFVRICYAFIMICGSRISGVICVPSLHQNNFFFHLRFSFKSVDFKIGTFTSFILILVVSCILLSSRLFSLPMPFNFSSSNPVSSILRLLVSTSRFPTYHCGSHLSCIVVSPVGVYSFSPLIHFSCFHCLCHSSGPQPSTCQLLLSFINFFFEITLLLSC